MGNSLILLPTWRGRDHPLSEGCCVFPIYPRASGPVGTRDLKDGLEMFVKGGGWGPLPSWSALGGRGFSWLWR